MQLIETNNVNNALIAGINTLVNAGDREESRNGGVIVAPWPVMTVLHNPTNRVLFNPARDANPFFHLFESLWMIAGRNDVDFVAQFVPRMESYSDDGETLSGAYGYRWRKHWGIDQIMEVAMQLVTDPASRRCVLSMWDVRDLYVDSLDKPCNTHIYFRIVKGRLDMTVCNRSNDIIWGLYGANTVHLSVLQEFIAALVGVEVGVYRHLSNNFHMYPANVNYRAILAEGVSDMYNPNLDNAAEPMSLTSGLTHPIVFTNDCEAFCNDPVASHPVGEFVRTVAQPMYKAWESRNPEFIKGNNDWFIAGREWLERREVKDESTG